MKIVYEKPTKPSRIMAVLQCEFCEHQELVNVKNDYYFREKDLPTMRCEECGKATDMTNHVQEEQANG